MSLASAFTLDVSYLLSLSFDVVKYGQFTFLCLSLVSCNSLSSKITMKIKWLHLFRTHFQFFCFVLFCFEMGFRYAAQAALEPLVSSHPLYPSLPNSWDSTSLLECATTPGSNCASFNYLKWILFFFFCNLFLNIQIFQCLWE